MKHYFNEGKERLKQDKIKNQGKSQKQIEDSYVLAACGFVGIFLTLLYLIISN